MAEALEHRQRTPEEDALLELLTILIEKFEEDRYPEPAIESFGGCSIDFPKAFAMPQRPVAPTRPQMEPSAPAKPISSPRSHPRSDLH